MTRGGETARSGRWLLGGHWTLMLLPPTVWALHFLLLYIVAGVLCEKLPGAEAIAWIGHVTIAATTVALLLVGLAGWLATRRLLAAADFGDLHASHEADASAAVFFARTTLLLTALSAVAIVFDALPALLSASCG